MSHASFISYALQLAKKGSGYVLPNPLVGCVIVKDNQIISEGYHQYFGGPHAEVNAIKSLENKGFQDWDKVTLYVTLEPCSHFGKTPPCTNLILEKGIKKVVISTSDPNPIVAGKGIQKLKENGVEVITGVLEYEAKELNKRFFTYHLKHRPYVILKWAETKDGYISKLQFQSREENIISSLEALKLVHLWRSEENSIMVGYNTIVKDNPMLNVRYCQGKNPIKIIWDKYLSLNPSEWNVFLSDEKIIVLNEIKDDEQGKIIYKKINSQNFALEMMRVLYELNIVSVLIEGGKQVLEKMINANIFDEIRVITSKNKLFHSGLKSPELPNNIGCAEEINLAEDVIRMYKKME